MLRSYFMLSVESYSKKFIYLLMHILEKSITFLCYHKIRNDLLYVFFILAFKILLFEDSPGWYTVLFSICLWEERRSFSVVRIEALSQLIVKNLAFTFSASKNFLIPLIL